MPGEYDPITIQARRVLLDALEALEPHREAIILAGAQAIYLHTGEGDLAVAPYTADADLALDPQALGEIPPLEAAMQSAGFTPGMQPGIWNTRAAGVTIDLLVPEAVGGRPGKRAAHLKGHGQMVARQVQGLEAVLSDHAPMPITALEEGDPRQIEVNVAGPGALLVAKLYKVNERRNDPRRAKPKDALDIFRLLQLPTETLAARLTVLQQAALTEGTTQEALRLLEALFGTEVGFGSQQAVLAAGVLADPAFIAAACAALAQDLLGAVQPS
jgi:hypothetical protein